MTSVVRRDAVAIAQPARAVLEGPRRYGAILGTSRDWTYLDIDGFVLVLGPSSRLPNAVGLGSDPLPATGRRGGAVIGERSVTFADAEVRVPSSVPTWDPSVPRWFGASDVVSRAREMVRSLGLRDLGGADAAARVIAAVARDGSALPALEVSVLFDGLAGGDLRRAVAVGRSMIGAGAGLTPDADDILWAILLVLNATVPAFSIGITELKTWGSALCPPDVEARTTRLSATLLRLAAGGLGPEPALRALGPSVGWQRGMEELWSLGHSSGRVACVAMAAAMSSLARRAQGAW